MIRVVTSSGDPVEMNEDEARRVAQMLLRLADRVADE